MYHRYACVGGGVANGFELTDSVSVCGTSIAASVEGVVGVEGSRPKRTTTMLSVGSTGGLAEEALVAVAACVLLPEEAPAEELGLVAICGGTTQSGGRGLPTLFPFLPPPPPPPLPLLDRLTPPPPPMLPLLVRAAGMALLLKVAVPRPLKLFVLPSNAAR